MSGNRRPVTALVCHAESRLNSETIARWLASFTELRGIVLIEEPAGAAWRRIRREVKRIGVWRFLDVLAFRLYYAAFLAGGDGQWLNRRLHELRERYADLPPTVEVLRTPDPNSKEAEAFLRRLEPDMTIVRCKRILKASIFSIAKDGTFVLHPGVCPEYRNAHGAFWALAQRDLANVGLTLLKIDAGVDTGPVYGYYSYEYDEVRESHIVIMTRLVLDNLDALRDRLLDIHAGTAKPLDTRGRPSAVWGQPWLTRYMRWKKEARQKRHASAIA